MKKKRKPSRIRKRRRKHPSPRFSEATMPMLRVCKCKHVTKSLLLPRTPTMQTQQGIGQLEVHTESLKLELVRTSR